MVVILFVLFMATCFSIAAYNGYSENVFYLYGSQFELGDIGSTIMATFFGLTAIFLYSLVIWASVRWYKEK